MGLARNMKFENWLSLGARALLSLILLCTATFSVAKAENVFPVQIESIFEKRFANGQGMGRTDKVIKGSDGTYTVIGTVSWKKNGKAVVSVSFTKIDSNGHILIEKLMGSAPAMFVDDVIQDSDGATYVTGNTSPSLFADADVRDYWILAIDKSGRALWRKPAARYGEMDGQQKYKTQMSFDAEGHIVEFGLVQRTSTYDNSGVYAYNLTKYDKAGNIILNKNLSNFRKVDSEILLSRHDGSALFYWKRRDGTLLLEYFTSEGEAAWKMGLDYRGKEVLAISDQDQDAYDPQKTFDVRITQLAQKELAVLIDRGCCITPSEERYGVSDSIKYEPSLVIVSIDDGPKVKSVVSWNNLELMDAALNDKNELLVGLNAYSDQVVDFSNYSSSVRPIRGRVGVFEKYDYDAGDISPRALSSQLVPFGLSRIWPLSGRNLLITSSDFRSVPKGRVRTRHLSYWTGQEMVGGTMYGVDGEINLIDTAANGDTIIFSTAEYRSASRGPIMKRLRNLATQ